MPPAVRTALRARVRAVACALALAVAVALAAATPATAATFSNPIVDAAPRTGSADPSVVFHRGFYWYCRAVGDRAIGVARARRLQDIGAAPMAIVHRPADGAPDSRQVWAPELQRVRGRWMIYYAASAGRNASHRMFALRAEGDDPAGPYRPMGRLGTADDGWAIDGAAVAIGRSLWFVWSGWPDPARDGPQLLYIARMRDPWTLVGPRHAIAAPELAWERRGAPLLEGPQPVRRQGRLHLVYSASASWGDDYALGLLTFAGGDPRRAGAWRKSPSPVFGRSDAARAYAVGHPSFVASPDGREDWIVYHANARPGAGWPGRSVRAQRVAWRRDGTPAFGEAVALGAPLEEPSGTPGIAGAGGAPAQRAAPASDTAARRPSR